jgi:hypothetical protein
MDVETDAKLPRELGNDNALLLLDRASVQQSVAQFGYSKRDFEAADKAIDMLDLAHDARDSIGEYVFSGSSGKYQAPPYEKLLINTLDMLNYLELHDLPGARVEARRLAVMQRYVSDELHETANSVLGLGGLLAGLTFEQSGDIDEALRWYDEALAVGGSRFLTGPIRRLLSSGHYRTPRLSALEGEGAAPAEPPASDSGEIVLVVGYGRVPHKVAHRIPIGLALTWFADALQPTDVAAANRLAAQGLVTWINYPTLGRERGGYEIPEASVDGSGLALEEAVDVTREVRAEWKKIEGRIIVSAITRMISRYVAGSAVKRAAGDSPLAFVLSLGTQATLTALDRPDTRSWETLPARVAIGRIRVPAGEHEVRLQARGARRDVKVVVKEGGWAVVTLMALR